MYIGDLRDPFAEYGFSGLSYWMTSILTLF